MDTYSARAISFMLFASITTRTLCLRLASSAIVRSTPSSSHVPFGLATKTGSEGRWGVRGFQMVVRLVCVSTFTSESVKKPRSSICIP